MNRKNRNLTLAEIETVSEIAEISAENLDKSWWDKLKLQNPTIEQTQEFARYAIDPYMCNELMAYLITLPVEVK